MSLGRKGEHLFLSREGVQRRVQVEPAGVTGSPPRVNHLVTGGAESSPVQQNRLIAAMHSPGWGPLRRRQSGRVSEGAHVGRELNTGPEAAYSRAQREEYRGTTQLLERYLDEYLNVFGYDERDLQGGRYLDIGSGNNLLFAKEAKRRGITVVSLNPDLGGTDYQSELLRRENREPLPSATRWERIQRTVRGEREPAVAAIGQLLPFRDGAFRGTFDLLAATEYLSKDQDSYHRYFGEAQRVVEPRGTNNILFWPRFGAQPFVDAELALLEAKGSRIDRSERDFEGDDAVVLRITKPGLDGEDKSA